MTSLRNVMSAWACHKKGPVYVAMFHPLGIVIAVCLGFIFLGDSLHLGRYVSLKICQVSEILK